MNGRGRIKAAIDFSGPDRLPLTYVNRDLALSDIVGMGFAAADAFAPDVKGRSEYGYIWHSLDDTMGQTHCPPLADFSAYENYVWPDAFAPGRMKHIAPHPDKYVLAGLGITGFNQLLFIRGYENVMEDIALDPARVEELFSHIVAFEEGIIEQYLRFPFIDGIAFGDDWGTQRTLMISPKAWRELFLPHYKRQFARIREGGRHVWFHTCGQVYDILGDLIDAGANVLNLNQPDVFPMERLTAFRGKACFQCPVDHQTVALSGTRDEIFAYAHRLAKVLGTENGGFIANIEDYACTGMPESNYLAICDAFAEMRAQEWRQIC